MQSQPPAVVYIASIMARAPEGAPPKTFMRVFASEALMRIACASDPTWRLGIAADGLAVPFPVEGAQAPAKIDKMHAGDIGL